MFKIGSLFILIFFLHFSGNALGIYDTQAQTGFVWFDNALHLLVGVAFGFLWLWFLKRKVKVTLFFKLTSMVIFVIVMAIIWELLEFAFYLIFTSQAIKYELYSPSIYEAVTDIFSNTVGALLVATKVGLKKKRPLAIGGCSMIL